MADHTNHLVRPHRALTHLIGPSAEPVGPHRALMELRGPHRKWNKQLENFRIIYAHVKIIEQQITNSLMKTIQKSRNHNFHMRRLTNYRFLHRLLPTMQQLYAVTNQCSKNRNKRLEKVRITHVHVEIIEKHIKRWHMKTHRNNVIIISSFPFETTSKLQFSAPPVDFYALTVQ